MFRSAFQSAFQPAFRPAFNERSGGGGFSGILDEVPGAVFAIAPYTQLSKAQTQSIEVRETGGSTEEIFGPESQAAIDAFVGANDGRIATAYNAGSEAADAVQATADNQPFIATAGVLEDGMRFNGSSTTLSMANGPRLNTGGTLAAWVYKASDGGIGFGRIFDRYDNSSYRLYVFSSNSARLDLSGSAGGVVTSTTDALPLNSWTHIAVTFVSGSQIMYINGVENATASSTNMPEDTDANLFIGNAPTLNRGWDGSISAATIWNRVLTPAEITKVYNATDPR